MYTKTHQINSRACGEIGIHVCLRNICRKACQFKSDQAHQSDYDYVYNLGTLSTLSSKKGSVERRSVSLRNYRPFQIFTQVESIIVFSCVFLNNQPLHQCVSFVYNRIQTIVDIHKCKNCQEKCSCYVRYTKRTTTRPTKTARRTS